MKAPALSPGLDGMSSSFWKWLVRFRKRAATTFLPRFLGTVVQLLRLPPPEKSKLLQRIRTMERDTVLPIKAAAIGMLLYSFYFTPWMWIVQDAFDIAIETTQYFLWIYIGINVVVAVLLLYMSRLPLALLEWTVFTSSLIDGIFLACLTLVTGGYNSMLYWIFLGLIVRGSVSVPRATAQLTLNLTLTAYYIVAGLIDIALSNYVSLPVMDHPDDASEPLILRILVLLLLTLSCYAVQVLLERQRQVLEESREFSFREGQLRSAGRLAAEIAHQLKNPLGIINNAAFSLKRALREGKTDPSEHLGIIQEEVERADRIITQVMGYAQLSEGHVERLNLKQELENSIAQVFPPGAGFNTRVHRDYGREIPPIFMLRRHLAETFLNLLQNAREAVGGRGGNVFVKALCHEDNSIEITIADDGPGVPAEKQIRIFEPYFTTKEKGSGLGLATVKHNVELYGGSVSLESELGKGARFTLIFPPRTVMKANKWPSPKSA
ncbi:MAG TPA: MFS domain-containing histidine kinase [Verrucomicrobiae bacterium]|nr:MFS domain-containing histidine kinase [Verrucomicrobiae bacterium]